jgi:hypothetical protein
MALPDSVVVFKGPSNIVMSKTLVRPFKKIIRRATMAGENDSLGCFCGQPDGDRLVIECNGRHPGTEMWFHEDCTNLRHQQLLQSGIMIKLVA